MTHASLSPGPPSMPRFAPTRIVFTLTCLVSLFSLVFTYGAASSHHHAQAPACAGLERAVSGSTILAISGQWIASWHALSSALKEARESEVCEVRERLAEAAECAHACARVEFLRARTLVHAIDAGMETTEIGGFPEALESALISLQLAPIDARSWGTLELIRKLHTLWQDHVKSSSLHSAQSSVQNDWLSTLHVEEAIRELTAQVHMDRLSDSDIALHWPTVILVQEDRDYDVGHQGGMSLADRVVRLVQETWLYSDEMSVDVHAVEMLHDGLGDWHAPSHHGAAGAYPWWEEYTGVYVVSNGEAIMPELSVADPRPQAAPLSLPGFQENMPFRWNLLTGSLILMPSYVSFHVLPNRSPDVVRQLVRFRVRLRGATPPTSSALHTVVEHPICRGAECAPAVLSQSVVLRWPTPLLKRMDERTTPLLGELLERILQLKESTDGVYKSNKGGWQSRADLFDRTDSEVWAALRNRAYAHTAHMLLGTVAQSPFMTHFASADDVPMTSGELRLRIDHSWACVNGPLDANAPHTHPRAVVSGVFYVDDGIDAEHDQPQPSLFLMDPRHHVGFHAPSSRVNVTAESGLFVLFPSWLGHYVAPHQGNRPRVAISFNVHVEFIPDPPGRSLPAGSRIRVKLPREHR